MSSFSIVGGSGGSRVSGGTITFDHPAYSAATTWLGGSAAGSLTILSLRFEIGVDADPTITLGTANGVTVPSGFVLGADSYPPGGGEWYQQIWVRVEPGGATPATFDVTWPTAWDGTVPDSSTCGGTAVSYALWPDAPFPPLTPITIVYRSAGVAVYDPGPDTMVTPLPVLPDTTNPWVALIPTLGPDALPVVAANGYSFASFGTGDEQLRLFYRFYDDPGDTPTSPEVVSFTAGVCSFAMVINDFPYTPPPVVRRRRGFGAIRAARG